MNRMEIIGNLTKDPESGTTAGGVNYCRFSVAVKKRFHREGQPDADFIRVTAWRGLGDTCEKYLRKGRKVYVEGYPQASAWTGQDGEARAQLELTANEVEFLGGGRAQEEAPRDPESGMEIVTDEDVPY